MLSNVIEACIATGSHAGTVTYIPRIKIYTDSDPSVLVPFERCQFPIALVCVSLRMCLDMADYYVALSRVKTPGSIKVMVDDNCNSKLPESVWSSGDTYTRNVVYTEVISDNNSNEEEIRS